MSVKVVLRAEKYAGGLGDFLRFVLSFFALFKDDKDVSMVIDCRKNPELGACFEPSPLPSSATTIFSLVDAHSINPLLDEIQRLKASGGGCISVCSNAVGFVDNLAKIRQCARVAFNSLFPLSQRLKANLERIRQINGVKLGCRYLSIHCRFGDAHMPKGCYPQYDHRCRAPKPFIQQASQKVTDLSKRLSMQFNLSRVFLHADSAEFKSTAATVWRNSVSIEPLLGVEMTHTATPNCGEQETLDTVSEFLFMAEATCILQVIYSGFSLWASVLGNVPLFRLPTVQMLPLGLPESAVYTE